MKYFHLHQFIQVYKVSYLKEWYGKRVSKCFRYPSKLSAKGTKAGSIPSEASPSPSTSAWCKAEAVLATLSRGW